MKKINKKSLKEFNKLKNQYKYYVATSYEDFGDTIDVSITFTNDSETFEDYLDLEFTPKFFKNKFKPKFLPSDDIFETYQCKEENFGWNPHHEEPWDKFGQEHTDFESEHGRKMNMEPDTKNVIEDREAGFKLTMIGDKTWQFKTTNDSYKSNEFNMELYGQERIGEKLARFLNINPYLSLIDKHKEKLVNGIKISEGIVEVLTPDQIYDMLNMIDYFFDKEEIIDYIETLDEGHKEIIIENIMSSIYSSIKVSGIENQIEDWEVVMNDNVIKLKNKRYL